MILQEKCYYNYLNKINYSSRIFVQIELLSIVFLKRNIYILSEFHEFAYIKLQKWRATYEYVLKNTTKLHVVFYEKLRESPIKEVRKMLKFLGVKPDEDRLACLSRHTEGRVKGAQKESDPYSLHEKMNMFSVVKAINSLLKERGFTDLPDYEF